MATLGRQIRGGYVLLVTVAAGMAALAILAARADTAVVGSRPAVTVLDLAVGFAYPIAAFAATGGRIARWGVGAVGAAWLAGSVLASALSLHQGILALVLLTFPTGKITGVARALLAAAAVAVACEVVPQPGVAALFAAVAVVAVTAPRGTAAAAFYPAAAGTVVAAALLFAWWAVRRDAPTSPLALYETTLIAVALGFPFATRAIARSAGRLADIIIGEADLAGLPGLRLVLADVLSDPDLRIDLWDAVTDAYVDIAGDTYQQRSEARVLEVFIAGELAARTVTTSVAMTDRPTSDAVCAAVRLAVVNHRLREAHARQVADGEAARVRLLAATDLERERAAARLRNGTADSLDEAAAVLATQTTASDPDLAALIGRAVSDIALGAAEVHRIVSGVPPAPLGEGRLRQAIESLAGHAAVCVSINVDDGTAADFAAETALFYVCSETLANASKHSGAGRVVVDLQRQRNELVLSIRDDGRGGADANGSGLRGLADRLAAAGGRLTVSSPLGEGTTVTATISVND